jgi:hypothetical protein
MALNAKRQDSANLTSEFNPSFNARTQSPYSVIRVRLYFSGTGPLSLAVFNEKDDSIDVTPGIERLFDFCLHGRLSPDASSLSRARWHC